MLREWSWALAAAVVLVLGVTCAESYARLLIPYYFAVTQTIAAPFPWKVIEVVVAQDGADHGAALRLTGEVRRNSKELRPAALVVSRVQVGEVIETPIVFWTLVMLWPGRSLPQRRFGSVVAIPVFLVLEALTTGCQLAHPLAEASALLAGERDPLTLLERWSRLLEAGGRFGLEVTAALLTIAVSGRAQPTATQPDGLVQP
jgi:hypothetical protein